MGHGRPGRCDLFQLPELRDDALQGEGLAQDMSEPRVDDDIALGLDETCDGCDELARHCTCSAYDRLEDLE